MNISSPDHLSPLSSTEHDDLAYLSASDALPLFRERKLSPVEWLDALHARVDRLNGPINALRSERWEAAYEAAQASERRYAQGQPVGPLDGVPVMLKNEHDLIGEETDQGSLLFAGERDTENAPLTQRLLDAGAVIHLRTQVPEFYMANFTRSVAHGVTRNPYKLGVTCGGSSGGSGAALAAGFGPLSSASDIGGSARIPSAYCGVVGLKASYGRVPEADFRFATNTFNHNGVMSRSVADATLMFNVINGPHPADPSTIRPKLELALPVGDVRGLRVAISADLGYFDIDPEIAASLQRCADMLREAGAVVESVDLPWDARVGKAYTDALVFVLGRGLGELIQDAPPDSVSDYVRSMADLAPSISTRDYLGALDTMAAMHESLQAVFERHDVMICPTLGRNDMRAEGLAAPHDSLLQQALTYPFNMLSRHPVLAVPSGLNRQGVPMGVQIVGQTFSESVVMEVGQALESRVGWRQWRPRFVD